MSRIVNAVSSSMSTANRARSPHPNDAFDRLDAALLSARRDAGGGCSPERERRLNACLRTLRPQLDDALAELAQEAVDAAKRALDSASPDAPLLTLTLAHDRLRAAVRQSRMSAPLPHAA